jgi:hypothetical protein
LRDTESVEFSVLLWDFGNTLVDERWMLRAPVDCPHWATVWTDVMTAQADAWNAGELTISNIYEFLSEGTGMSTAAVKAHARTCCHQLLSNETAWRLASGRCLPQAIVTVNPDLFAEFIVPHYKLAEVFDEIVMSWSEGTNQKTTLCDIALSRLAFDCGRERALLIDNRLDLVEEWRQLGGSSYWFRSDEQFATDLPDLLG